VFIKAAALEFATLGITVDGVGPGKVMTRVSFRAHQGFVDGNMTRSIPVRRLGSGKMWQPLSPISRPGGTFRDRHLIIVGGHQTLPERSSDEGEPWALS